MGSTKGISIMKRTALAFVLATGLTASPAMAQQQHDHANQAASQQQEHAGHSMQDSEAMKAHREKMQKHMASMMKGDGADMMAACHQRMKMMLDLMEQMAARQDMAQND